MKINNVLKFFSKYSVLIIMILLSAQNYSQNFSYTDPLHPVGFSLARQNANGIELNYSIHIFNMETVSVNGQNMVAVRLPDVFLPNNEGYPDLPGNGKYIAIPQGAQVNYKVVSSRTETINNVLIAPAPRIPKDTEVGPLEYRANEDLYDKNEFYPLKPVTISPVTRIRGVDVVLVGITPFQYNPMTKQLIVYRDLTLEVTFVGGNGQFGDNALRSRWFDPILEDAILNYASLPQIDYDRRLQQYYADNSSGCEYLIIRPTNPEFAQWADSIRNFRLQQGIITKIMTIVETGGNTPTALETFINNAYANWTIKPAAILLLGDYGTDPANTITSPIYNSYCVSDNILGDVNADHMPDIVMARMTAQNSTHLQTMITKFLNYEKNPPTNPDFYNKPITALGWQTERWFQICSEVVGGFWKKGLGKNPVRVNAIYSGTPSTTWSTATNTATVVSYFGPQGLYYIPQTPDSLGGWSGGTASMVNTAINNGSFMLMHRDHGAETGWGEPAYSNSNIDGLTNTDLTYILSVNCLTGKYNYTSEVFAEKFHRYRRASDLRNSGALGIIAASEVSYSFVNDTYVWGLIDNMWPNFMPGYGTTPPSRDVKPAFGNAAGKYFLQQSSWPYNTSNKEVTYHLFHHHGDAFMSVYYNVPQNLTVSCPATIPTGVTSVNITANAGSFIAITLDTTILGTATGTGSPVTITIPGNQVPPQILKVVITKQNYYRYETGIQVIPNSGSYVIKDTVGINDASPLGNGNGMIDYGETNKLNVRVKNVGTLSASNVIAKLRTTDSYITITDSTETFGTVNANSTVNINNAFTYTVANNIPDGRVVNFLLVVTNGTDTWTSNFSFTAHAPVMKYSGFKMYDSLGNNNNIWESNETAKFRVTVKNLGTSLLNNVVGTLTETDPFITIVSGNANFGNIAPGDSVVKEFRAKADSLTPMNYAAKLFVNLTANSGFTSKDTINTTINGPYIVVPFIGTGTTAAGWPFYTFYHDSRTQMLYLASEITGAGGTAGHITKIGFNVITPAAQVMNGFMIKMKHTNLTTLSAWESTGFTTVYSGTYTVPGGGWQEITLQTPYQYNATENLIIEICFDNTSYTSNTTVNSSSTTGSLVKHNHVDNGVGCSLTGTSTAATRPNICLTIEMIIPVELTSFVSVQDGRDIILTWSTATETNNSGFAIERRLIDGEYSQVGFVKGNGTTANSSSYTFIDKSPKEGQYYYRLRQVDYDGTASYSTEIMVEITSPKVYTLEQNYPNPFNPSTLIRYSLEKDGLTNISIYNALGQKVATIVNEIKKAGSYDVIFDASKLASGVYFYRMESGNFISIKKMLFIK